MTTDTITLEAAIATVHEYLAASAASYSWRLGNAVTGIQRQDAAEKALATLPALEKPRTFPVYPSVDDRQGGFMVVGHLDELELAAVPALAVSEMLQVLASECDLRLFGGDSAPPCYMLESYGPRLAELLVDGIAEALASRSQSHKRLKDYDGTRFAPIDDDDPGFDEPYYDRCGPDDEHATPVTEFDFTDALDAAAELVETRDRAAKLMRRGDVQLAIGELAQLDPRPALATA